MRIYLAGPMRGIENHNFPLFNEYAEILRQQGHIVFNPAELGIPQENLREIMEKETQWLCQHGDAVALLPGWQQSLGANAERAIAVALGLKVIEL